MVDVTDADRAFAAALLVAAERAGQVVWSDPARLRQELRADLVGIKGLNGEVVHASIMAGALGVPGRLAGGVDLSSQVELILSSTGSSKAVVRDALAIWQMVLDAVGQGEAGAPPPLMATGEVGSMRPAETGVDPASAGLGHGVRRGAASQAAVWVDQTASAAAVRVDQPASAAVLPVGESSSPQSVAKTVGGGFDERPERQTAALLRPGRVLALTAALMAAAIAAIMLTGNSSDNAGAAAQTGAPASQQSSGPSAASAATPPVTAPQTTNPPTPTPSATVAPTTATVVTSAPPSTLPAALPAGDFVAVIPRRLMDTRTGLGLPGGGKGPQTVALANIAGETGGLPLTAVKAVVLNVTVTDPSRDGYITVFATDTRPYDVSHLAFGAASTQSSMVVTPRARLVRSTCGSPKAWPAT